MVAVIVGLDVAFFKNRFWERLIANVGIVLVFGAFYFEISEALMNGRSTPPSGPRETFDPAYARRLEDPERFRTLSPETIVAFVDAPPGAVVVDYGAGTGAYAVPFAQARPDCRIIAIDIEPQLLEVLRAKPEAATIRTGGLDLLAELSGTIDRIFSLHVMHYLGVDDLRRIFGCARTGRASGVRRLERRRRAPARPGERPSLGCRGRGTPSGERRLRRRANPAAPYHYAFFGRVQP